MRKALFLTVFLPLSLAARAQNSTEQAVEERSKDAAKPVQSEKKAAAAAQASREAAPLEGGEDVSYEDILKDPDNVELNRRYAQQQIRKGNLRAATTTLERLTLLRPGDASVRLLHGVVLYRLDDAVAAERELKAVLALDGVPDRIRKEAGDYLKLARARQKNLHFDARVTFGAGFDDNVNAAPDDDLVRFFGSPLLLPEQSRRKRDANLQGIVSLGGSYDVGGPKGHTVFARFTHFRGEQQVYDILDLQAYSVEAGAVLRTRWAELRPAVSFDHVLLSQSSYLRGRNAGLRAERRVSRRVTAFAEFSHSDQDFVATPLIRTADQRDGDQFDYELGAELAASPVDRLTLSGLHRRKFARAVADAYRREGASLEWLRLLGKGAFASTTLAGQFDRYEQSDSFVEPVTVRKDDAVRFELLVGAPMSLLWKPLRSFTMTGGFEHFMQSSNIPNYTYSNNKLSALVTYQWGT